MSETENKDKTYPAGQKDSWHIFAAYKLGRAARKIFNTAGSPTVLIEETTRAAKNSFQKISDKIQSSCQQAKMSLRDMYEFPSYENPSRQRSLVSLNRGEQEKVYHTSSMSPEDKISPLLQEIRAIADVSGLTSALLEMKNKALGYSGDPALTQFVANLEQLTPVQQESLANRFLERLKDNVYFKEMFQSTYLTPVSMAPEVYKETEDALIMCLYQSLKDSAIPVPEFQYLQELTDDISKPLHNLMQLYFDPQTIFQKLKRLWNIQRIGFKALKLIHKTSQLTEISN
ncbi:MAG: hypothetical protein ABIH08_06565 [Candidatus Omnitrophota bacterium]